MPNHLEKYILIEPQTENPQLSFEDYYFWGDYPPEQVVIATGSVRKALMLVAEMNDFRFDVLENEESITITKPMDLQAYFNRNIFNGNGALTKKTFLGYLYGVPVFAEPSNGETESNENPYEEAKNKAQDLYKKYEGRKVLIVSTDTVDRPEASEFPLGKPENEADFPKEKNYTKVEKFDEAAADYLEEFKQRFYASSKKIIHTNAVAVLNAVTGLFIEIEEHLLELEIKINKEKLREIELHRDMGGGGATQQLVDWDDPAAVKGYFDKFTLDFLNREAESLSEVEKFYAMALFCQISGMPYAIIELIRLAQKEIIER